MRVRGLVLRSSRHSAPGPLGKHAPALAVRATQWTYLPAGETTPGFIERVVVQALQITLTGGPLTRREGGTQNLEAYQLYLRALAWTAQAANTIDLAWARALPWDEAFERGRQLAQHAAVV